MIRAVIIDDEKNNIDNLAGLLGRHCAEIGIVASANNAEEGKQIIIQHAPELVFLDIQMPGKNGFELLRELSTYEFEIIFVTAFDAFGIQAIKFSAIDYLLKPVNVEELKAAVNRVAEKHRLKKQNLELENLVQQLQSEQRKEAHRIVLRTARESRFLFPRQIIRCESSNSYTRFYLEDGEKLLVSRPIYEYETMLVDYGFLRCHQSHLVNTAFVKSWIREAGDQLLLRDGSHIPVSRGKKEAVMQRLAKND